MKVATQGIEIYRGASLAFEGFVPISSVVRPTLERMLGVSLADAQIRLFMLRVPDGFPAPGSPSLLNLLPDYGYAYVAVVTGGRVIYQHPHPIEDLMAPELRRILREWRPDEKSWAFCINLDRQERPSSVRPTPPVEGVVAVTPGNGDPPSFVIRRISEERPPEISLTDFAVTAQGTDRAAPIKVLLPRVLAHDIATRPLSSEVEEGGFLVGRVFQESGGDDTYIVHLTGAETADYTGASLFHFTFTGDSFGAVKRTLREQRPGDRLLGWYHTHLFAATEAMGLSSIDVTLHCTTFTLPWQVAGLVNVERNERTLRFYARRGQAMIRCPHWVTHD